MALLELYSKRKKREAGGFPDVFQYEKIPQPLRAQVIHLWKEGFGPATRDPYGDHSFGHSGYQGLHDALCREYGWFTLGTSGDPSPEGRCFEFLKHCDTDQALDIIELSFRFLENVTARAKKEYRPPPGPLDEERTSELISELNARFKESGVGYQFEDGQIVRVDSQLLHAEAVKPALRFLTEEGFDGADAEFRSAFDHYRHGKTKEALNDALKAFESAMKTICKRKGWSVSDNATASQLIDVVLANGLLPKSMTSHFTGLRTTLEAGVPTVRNKLGGHGQGEQPVEVPGYLAAYAIHLAASNIVLLVEAYRAIK